MTKLCTKNNILGITIVLFFGLGIGALFGAGDSAWYQTLKKPAFNPPAVVFAPVWILLYIIIGYVFGTVIDKNPKSIILQIYIIQLILNFSWTPAFFYFNRIDIALLIIVLLVGLILIIECLLIGAQDKKSALLLLPYLAWMIFAALLTYQIFVLN
jgi:Tryptophan-rich sensory protein (mitochondrial benzodiazepine receptor homolog)